YPVLFTPPGYVFSIWGVIYLLLITLGVAQLRSKMHPVVQRIGPFFALSCLFNGLWLLAWHHHWLFVSWLLIVGLLLCLAVIYRRLIISGEAATLSSPLRWLLQLAFSIYLAWLCVATIANTTILLAASEWSAWGLSASLWTAIMIGTAAVLGAALALYGRDPVFPWVFVWAVSGIASIRGGDDVIVGSAWIASIALAGLAIVLAVRLAQHRIRQRVTCSPGSKE
ncbi:MAG: tryptophan-rich sensory protein, partial [Myxococcota bacterium]|nr:tryptophan-rich sensory protein [Myxococcota bacterium]